MSLLDLAHSLPDRGFCVLAVHVAVVVDVECPTHGIAHRLVVCEECETCDGATLDDEDCPTVVDVAHALGYGDG